MRAYSWTYGPNRTHRADRSDRVDGQHWSYRPNGADRRDRQHGCHWPYWRNGSNRTNGRNRLGRFATTASNKHSFERSPNA